jgi:hypothetical protein
MWLVQCPPVRPWLHRFTSTASVASTITRQKTGRPGLGPTWFPGLFYSESFQIDLELVLKTFTFSSWAELGAVSVSYQRVGKSLSIRMFLLNCQSQVLEVYFRSASLAGSRYYLQATQYSRNQHRNVALASLSTIASPAVLMDIPFCKCINTLPFLQYMPSEPISS